MSEQKHMSWTRTLDLRLSGAEKRGEVEARLEALGFPVKGYVNWFTLRWPNMSFIGGVSMGNEPTDLEIFYEKPFRWWNGALENVVDNGGNIYGLRVRYRGVGGPPDIDCQPPGVLRDDYTRSVGPGYVPGCRSYLLYIRGEVLTKQGYHPSYILANGRRIWDSRIHPLCDGKIYAPFWNDADCDELVIDLVVDMAYTPDIKGLAFRNGHLQFAGMPGDRISLAGAPVEPEGSPADRLERFVFGAFPSDNDFWSRHGPTFDEIREAWKPNFKPDYPVDELWLSPVVFRWLAEGAYHDFMVTYGGCNILGCAPPREILERAPCVRGVLGQSVEAAKAILAMDPSYEVHWMSGEHGVLWLCHGETGKLIAHDSEDEDDRRIAEACRKIAEAKAESGDPDRVLYTYEPFPVALTCAREYERGADIMIVKNEEDPQYNIIMSMARGAGRSYGKPFGFYWEQSHYPYPGFDMKLQACLLYYLSGGSWIGAEMEWAPAFNNGIVADWVLPYVKAMRFAMLHPARGRPLVPIGILWGHGDRWWAPYNALGAMDTFQRYVAYDHASRSFTCEPAFVEPLHYMPRDPSEWTFLAAGHLAYFHGHTDELKGYDLLDVFFPQYGDALTARIARLLTGTPCGPVDFVYGDQASVDTLQTYGMIAILGRAQLTASLEEKLTAAARSGTPIVVGAQHFNTEADTWCTAFGLRVHPAGLAPVAGTVTSDTDLLGDEPGTFAGPVYAAEAEGWETIASVGDVPVIIRKAFGTGMVHVFLGQWMHQGGMLLRRLLAALGEQAAPLSFSPSDDQMEYVSYRKGPGAWVALFNHGAIPVGCDRLKEPRAIPPEPLVSEVKGAYVGRVAFRLDRLGLEANVDYQLYEVKGIDGKAFDGVISGYERFKVVPVDAQRDDGMLTTMVTINHRAQYLVAPRGQGEKVFFGNP